MMKFHLLHDVREDGGLEVIRQDDGLQVTPETHACLLQEPLRQVGHSRCGSLQELSHVDQLQLEVLFVL